MADIQLIIEQPDIRLDTDTTRLQSRVQRHTAPIVVVGVASDGDDVARDIGRPVGDVVGIDGVTAKLPVARGAVVFIRKEREDDSAGEGDELNDTPGDSRIRSSAIHKFQGPGHSQHDEKADQNKQ